MTEHSKQSTVHPDGWVGDPEELALARRYRAILKWGFPVFIGAFLAYWLVEPPWDSVLLGLLVSWLFLTFFFQSRISRAIGRKWNWRLENKEIRGNTPVGDSARAEREKRRRNRDEYRDAVQEYDENLGLAGPDSEDPSSP